MFGGVNMREYIMCMPVQLYLPMWIMRLITTYWMMTYRNVRRIKRRRKGYWTKKGPK